MTVPLTDDDLRSGAYRLSGAMVAMLRADGLDPDIIGIPDQQDANVFTRSFQIDAELYMSMNPDRLGEEFDEIRKAALATLDYSDPNGVVDALKTQMDAWWHGEAAQTFSRQLNRIQTCIAKQYAFTLLAAHAASMMYALSAQFRASCRDLMEKTADTCQAIAAEQPNPGLDWASIGVSFAKAVIDGIKSADPGKVAGWAVDQLLGQATAALEPKPVPGDKAIPVVDGYISARDALFTSYEDNLEQIRAWIQGRWQELHDNTDAIPEPLPASTDVDGPDFRYENFAYHDHAHPEEYAPEVERERQRYAAEKAKPGGVISQRLTGEG